MALYAFDGTGNEDKADTEEGGYDSNVLHFFRAYDDPAKDFERTTDLGSLYLKGIGKSARTVAGDKVAQAFGLGGHRRIRQMLDRLENNYEAGDTDIHIIGFSRGAALAIAFANEIADKYPTMPVHFIGVWDIVGSFYLPDPKVNLGYNLKMPRNAQHCYHAMALDETRLAFQVTRLAKGYAGGAPQEVWFRGVHSDVGGGNGNFGLNWISLDWMFANALRHGLPIEQAAVDRNRERAALPQDVKEHKVAVGPKRDILPNDLLHASVQVDPADRHHQHNDPALALRRGDNAGTIV